MAAVIFLVFRTRDSTLLCPHWWLDEHAEAAQDVLL